MKKQLISGFSISTFLLAAIMMVLSCSRNPVTGKRELMLMSENQEKAMGAQSDPSIVAQFGIYQDEKIQAFINEKGKQMAAISHRPNLDYSFKVMDSPVVNAFAVPGGYVYFTRGILAHFNNEAEFAGVLGHEIGHVTARHSAKQYSKQMLAQVGFIAGVIVSPTFRSLAESAQQGLGLLFLKFGRDAETQSDKLGVEYSTKIGYDAHEMANFFQTIGRLQKAAGAEIPDFLSTHPNPVNRFNNVHTLADQWQESTNKSQLQVNREKYLRMIDGLVYGEDPRQGYVEDDRFYHPELKFTFPIPRGWKTQNSPAAFRMGEANGKAMMVLSLAPQKTLDEAANAFISENKLTLINNQRGNVNGIPAIKLLAEQTPQQGQQQQQQQQQAQAISVIGYMIEYNGLIYKLVGMSLKQDFRTYQSMMENTMSRFEKLTDRNKLNVSPDRINIKSAPRNMTFQEAAQPYAKDQKRLQTLAILNGMELTTQLQAGDLFKVVGK